MKLNVFKKFLYKYLKEHFGALYTSLLFDRRVMPFLEN